MNFPGINKSCGTPFTCSEKPIDEHVDYPDWHFNVRTSANDPLIRLNLEAPSQAEMERRRDEVLAVIRG